MALFSLSLLRSRPERTMTVIAVRTITHTTPTSMMTYYNPNFCDPGRGICHKYEKGKSGLQCGSWKILESRSDTEKFVDELALADESPLGSHRI
jgi:hypothetical protein